MGLVSILILIVFVLSALILILVIGFTIILTLGKMLVPVLASLVIAFLLESIVNQFEKRNFNRLTGVIVVNIIFVLFLLWMLFGMAPLLSTQLSEFVRELPVYINKAQLSLMQIPQHYPFISESQLKEISALLNKEIANTGQRLLSMSLSSIPGRSEERRVGKECRSRWSPYH